MKQIVPVVISRGEVIEILKGVNSPQFVSMITMTDLRMRSMGNPYYGQVKNLTRKYKIITGFNFKNQGNVGKGWFKCLSKGLVVHKTDLNKYYFRYQRMRDSVIEQELICNGNSIPFGEVENFIIDIGKYTDVDNKMRYETVSIDNIVELTMDGYSYILVD